MEIVITGDYDDADFKNKVITAVDEVIAAGSTGGGKDKVITMRIRGSKKNC